jgi:hypothetical protein
MSKWLLAGKNYFSYGSNSLTKLTKVPSSEIIDSEKRTDKTDKTDKSPEPLPFVSFVSTFGVEIKNKIGNPSGASFPIIPFDPPYLLNYCDPNLGFAQKLPYTQTPAFDSEISQARAFLKQLYLRGIDIEIMPENGLRFIPMPNQPTQEDLKEAKRMQHGIRYQIENPIDLYAQDLMGSGEIGVRLDDRHSCLECSNLTPSNSCREVVRYGKFVAWLDSQWPEKKHRCERFRVRAVRH